MKFHEIVLTQTDRHPFRLGAVLAVMLVSAVLAIAILVVVLVGIQAAASFGQ
jgi:hypothetical protein